MKIYQYIFEVCAGKIRNRKVINKFDRCTLFNFYCTTNGAF
jgi:hypothetical protein